MIRTLSIVERNTVDKMVNPVTLAAGVAKDVIDDSENLHHEIANIELFNAGSNNAYYAFGRTCDNVNNFNAYIAPGQMLEVPVRQRVSMFSVGGTIIGVTIILRRP